jgi:hypothetical protein
LGCIGTDGRANGIQLRFFNPVDDDGGHVAFPLGEGLDAQTQWSRRSLRVFFIAVDQHQDGASQIAGHIGIHIEFECRRHTGEIGAFTQDEAAFLLKLPVAVHDLFQDAWVEAAGGQRFYGIVGEGEGLVVGLVKVVALPDQFDVVVRFWAVGMMGRK